MRTAALILMVLWGCKGYPVNPAKPHHLNNGFQNPYAHDQANIADFFKWRLTRTGRAPDKDTAAPFPPAGVNPLCLRSDHKKNTLTWIGQSTLMFQTAGSTLLTDPIFSQRASPVEWAGPVRITPPGIPFERLPKIDIVVISHDHYDHLDEETIMQIVSGKGGDSVRFFVPLGMKDWFTGRGVHNVEELDWWESRTVTGGVTVTAVPIQHWSKRSLFSRNKTLWAGWVIRSSTANFFFAGDTGYCPVFKEIGDRLGPFDIAAIPIGAYAPRWFMAPQHVNPEEAVKIHLDIKSKKSVAIHWGTFILSDEPFDEPPKKLADERQKAGLPENAFMLLKHGETVVF